MRLKKVTALTLALLMLRLLAMFTFDLAEYSGIIVEKGADTDDDPLHIENPNQDAFAACLMIMDDNRRLIEWIPYHYYVLPLRHLVVFVDGPSTVSRIARQNLRPLKALHED